MWPPSLSLSSTVHEVHENLFPGIKSGIQICSRGKRKIENPRNQTPSKVSHHKVCSQGRTHRNPQNSVDSPGGSSVRVWVKAVCYNDVRKSKQDPLSFNGSPDVTKLSLSHNIPFVS